MAPFMAVSGVAAAAGQAVGSGRKKPGKQKAASKVRRETKNTAQRAKKSRARKNRTQNFLK